MQQCFAEGGRQKKDNVNQHTLHLKGQLCIHTINILTPQQMQIVPPVKTPICFGKMRQSRKALSSTICPWPKLVAVLNRAKDETTQLLAKSFTSSRVDFAYCPTWQGERLTCIFLADIGLELESATSRCRRRKTYLS